MNFKRLSGVASITALLVALTGCVMPDQMSQIQKDVADVRQQLRQVQDQQAETLARLERVEAESKTDPDAVTRADAD